MNRLFILIVILLSSPALASRLVPVGYQALDGNGKPIAGAKLYTYENACAVAQSTWSVEASIDTGGDLNTNPVVANAAGRFGNVFGTNGDDYCLVLKTSGGVTVWSRDLVYGEATAYPYTSLSVTSNTATAAITGTNTNTGYGIKAVTSAGSGNALWCEADISSPAKSSVHIVPQDATPTVPIKGDLWFDSVTGDIRFYDGTTAREIVASGSSAAATPVANHHGGVATGNGTGSGFYGTGGNVSGSGVTGIGGAPAGDGGTFTAAGAAGIGIRATGTNGWGVVGLATNGVGVAGTSTTSGYGVWGSSTDGGGVYGISTNYYGVTAVGDTTSPARASLRIGPQDTAPTSPAEGDVYYNSTTHHLYVRLAAAWAQLDP
jgi:hypothetical protein